MSPRLPLADTAARVSTCTTCDFESPTIYRNTLPTACPLSAMFDNGWAVEACVSPSRDVHSRVRAHYVLDCVERVTARHPQQTHACHTVRQGSGIHDWTPTETPTPQKVFLSLRAYRPAQKRLTATILPR